MKVSVILQGMGDREIATIPQQATAREAVEMLSARGIGALVVSPDGNRIDGIISERDIVRRLGAEGPAALDALVGAIMTADVSTAKLDDTAIGLLGRMTRRRFRHLPVVDDDGKMIGILSIGDIVKVRLEEIERENRAMLEMLTH